MKKLIMVLILLLAGSCVNNNWEVPNQDGQDESGKVNLIQYDF
jgi:hypothetical protein